MFSLHEGGYFPQKGQTYLLMSETRAANGFSQAYILIILIPDTTSFIVRILLSVRVAVLLLKTRTVLQYQEDATVAVSSRCSFQSLNKTHISARIYFHVCIIKKQS